MGGVKGSAQPLKGTEQREPQGANQRNTCLVRFFEFAVLYEQELLYLLPKPARVGIDDVDFACWAAGGVQMGIWGRERYVR